MECLSKNLPFFDRSIEGVILTSLTQNNIGGLTYVVNRYHVKTLYSSLYLPDTKNTVELIKSIEKQAIPHQIYTDNFNLTILNTQLKLIRIPSTLSFVPVYIENDKKTILTGHIASHFFDDIVKLQRVTPYLVDVHILQLPVLGVKESLLQELITLADPTYTVINTQKTQNSSVKLKKLIYKLESLEKNYNISNLNEDIVFYLN